MPLTPDEVLEKNKGKKNLQFERAVQDLIVEAEEAITYYTGNPIYIGLSPYLQYKAQADKAQFNGPLTLEAVDNAMDEHFGPAGWSASIVTNQTQSYHWAKLRDKREV